MVEYYTKILDFSLVEQSAQGAFLTTTFDHHCVVITNGEKKARSVVGYEIWEPLDDAQAWLRTAGYEVQRRTDIAPSTPDVLVLDEPGTGVALPMPGR